MPASIFDLKMQLRIVCFLAGCFPLCNNSYGQVPNDSVLRTIANHIDSLRTDFYFFQDHRDVVKVIDAVTATTRTIFPPGMLPAQVAEYKRRDSVRHWMGWSIDSSLKSKLDTAACLLRCRFKNGSCTACEHKEIQFYSMDWHRYLPSHGTFLQVLWTQLDASDLYLFLFDHGGRHLEVQFSGGRLKRMRWVEEWEFSHFGARRQ